MRKMGRRRRYVCIFIALCIHITIFTAARGYEPEIQAFFKNTHSYIGLFYIAWVATAMIVPFLPAFIFLPIVVVLYGGWKAYLLSISAVMIGGGTLFFLMRRYGKIFEQKILLRFITRETMDDAEELIMEILQVSKRDLSRMWNIVRAQLILPIQMPGYIFGRHKMYQDLFLRKYAISVAAGLTPFFATYIAMIQKDLNEVVVCSSMYIGAVIFAWKKRLPVVIQTLKKRRS